MSKKNEMPWKILIVDDDEDIHDVTEMALRRLVYEDRPLLILHAFSALEAKLRLIENPDVAVALLDVVMENDTAGLDLVKTIRDVMKNDNIRLILRTGNPGKAPEESVTLAYDINDYRGKTELTAQSLRTAVIIALRSYQAVITIKNLHKEIDDTQKELIYTLGEIAESRSLETGHHVKRVSEISSFLAEKLNLPNDHVDLIGLAASMHDLGKMAIDDRILNKPGKLTKDEFEIVKKHSALGYEILKNSKRELLQLAAVIAHEHHENYDGSGYPRGLKGDEISLESRIVGLVDVYDALFIKRVYKESWPKKDILEYMRSQRGIKFDPLILDVFFENLEELEAMITLKDLWS
jgi:response regulator RpfG family c-di-GMP phosphodiesterase